MLQVETYVAPSAIHGLGLFAAQDIEAGTVIDAFWEDLDQVFTEASIRGNERLRRFLDFYGYRSRHFGEGKLIILGFDGARHLNHSDTPNTCVVIELQGVETVTIALRLIKTGEEITGDYRTFDLDWERKLSKR